MFTAVLLTLIWNSSPNGVEGLTCYQCSHTKDPHLCNDPWPVGSTLHESQLAKCDIMSRFCQIGVRLMPTVDPHNNKISVIMGRSCSSTETTASQIRNPVLWGTLPAGAWMACEETRRPDDDGRVVDFRCICQHDYCNGLYLREILRLRMEQPFWDPERGIVVGVRSANELNRNNTVSPEMTGGEEIDHERRKLEEEAEYQRENSGVDERQMNGLNWNVS